MKGLFQCPPKLLPLQGALLIAIIPRAMPWARSFWAFSPYLNHMRNFSKLLTNHHFPLYPPTAVLGS